MCTVVYLLQKCEKLWRTVFASAGCLHLREKNVHTLLSYARFVQYKQRICVCVGQQENIRRALRPIARPGRLLSPRRCLAVRRCYSLNAFARFSPCVCCAPAHTLLSSPPFLTLSLFLNDVLAKEPYCRIPNPRGYKREKSGESHRSPFYWKPAMRTGDISAEQVRKDAEPKVGVY